MKNDGFGNAALFGVASFAALVMTLAWIGRDDDVKRLRAERDAARDSLSAATVRLSQSRMEAFMLRTVNERNAVDPKNAVAVIHYGALAGGAAPRWYPMADRTGAVLVERDSVRQVSRWMR